VDASLDVRVEGAPGAISARAFLEVLRSSLDLLDQLERAEHRRTKPAGDWLIAELQNSSAAATLHRPDAPGLQTPRRLVEGIAALREQQELPAYFSADVAEGLAKIGKQVRRQGVTGVSFSLPAMDGEQAQREQLSEGVVANALASVQDSDRALGSVAGILDVINLRRGAHVVSLYDDEARRAVRCRFPDELFETLRAALGRRVRALGQVTRNSRGQILRVEIHRVEVLPEAQDVPSVDDLVGIAPWYTGEQSTDDFLRSVRGA